jgi:hypothetical protein
VRRQTRDPAASVSGETVAVSVGLNGEAKHLLVARNSADELVARTEQPGWASFPKSHTETEYSAILAVSGTSGSREIYLSDMTATFPKISDGKEEQEFLLGDGISYVQADNKGNIWVGYFDEGAYGNLGWQYADGSFGAAGLSCFSQSGQKMWDFEPPQGFDSISDCYALNVCEAGVWAYYYTGFPIALIESPNGVSAAGMRNHRAGTRSQSTAKESSFTEGTMIVGSVGRHFRICDPDVLADLCAAGGNSCRVEIACTTAGRYS